MDAIDKLELRVFAEQMMPRNAPASTLEMTMSNMLRATRMSNRNITISRLLDKFLDIRAWIKLLISTRDMCCSEVSCRARCT
jgi:hypothetical protein